MRFKYFALALVLAGCTAGGPTLYPESSFKAEADGGVPVSLYTLKNGGITAQITNFGGRVVSLWTPGSDGSLTDIVVGHDNIGAYMTPAGERFLGATVGPVANRIGGATYKIGDEVYHTDANDNGVNTLHGGFKGIDMRAWNVVASNDSTLRLSLKWVDGDEGFPGNTVFTLEYQLLADASLKVVMEAESDKDTPVNMAHHPFFNLRGEGEGSIEDYVMEIAASAYIPIDSLSIPIGEIAPVEGTPFDFRKAHTIGQMIGEPHPQLLNGRGYDHNWCLDRKTGCDLEFAARVTDPVTGRFVEIFTDQPGLQFYSGNFFDGSECGKSGKPLGFRSSLALETQKWPDAVNHDNFPSTLLKAGDKYSHTAIYHFGVATE
ncbi:MAG: galactose mutarotase [Bacteroidales bacterium]|nr:galactose mutarotase [Bacteroidales bacterium]